MLFWKLKGSNEVSCEEMDSLLLSCDDKIVIHHGNIYFLCTTLTKVT